MAAIPESHPVTEPLAPSHRYRNGQITDRSSPTYSVTADCTQPPDTTTATAAAAAASDISHGMTQPAAAMDAPFMRRIRVTSKPGADVSMMSQPTWQTCVRSSQQAMAAGSSDAAAAANRMASSNQKALHRNSTSHGAAAAAAAAGCDSSASDADVQQMSHTPLNNFSQTFRHDTALTHGTCTASGSPLPQRAVSEQPLQSGTDQTNAGSADACKPSTSLTHQDSDFCRGNADSGMTDTHRSADASSSSATCPVSEESSLTGQIEAEEWLSAQSQQLRAQPQQHTAQHQQLSAQSHQISAQPQQLSILSRLHSKSADTDSSNQQLVALGGSAGGSAGSFRGSSSWQLQGEESECRVGRGRARHQQPAESDRPDGAAMIVSGDDDWCELPASPRWWDNIAKTDVIGMKELQRYVIPAT